MRTNFSLFLLWLGLSGSSLPAQPFTTFNATTSNDWFLGSNWSAGVPNSGVTPYVPPGRTAVISGGTTVGQSLQTSNATVQVLAGGVGTFAAPFLDFNAGQGTAFQIDGTGSTLNFTGNATFSFATNSHTSVNVTNGGRFSSTGLDYYGFGNGSVTNITVTSGSYNTGTAQIAYNTGSTSTFNVSGSNSSYTSSGLTRIGNFGNGFFNLSGGAQATTAALDIAAGALSGAGGSSGTVTISGANTNWTVNGQTRVGAYSGTTTFANGSLSITDGASFNAPGQTVVIARGSRVTVGNGGVVGAFNVGGVGFVDQFSTNSWLTFNHSNNLTISAVLSGLGTLVKDGAGTLTLTGANTKFGDTQINAGTLQLGGNGTLGSNNGTLILNGGTLDLNGFTQTISLLSVTADSSLLMGATTLMPFFSAAASWSGSLLLPDFVPNSDQLYFANGLSPAQLAQIQVPGWTADSIQSGYVHFIPSAVPEPATWLAGCAALGLAGRLWRKRRGV